MKPQADTKIIEITKGDMQIFEDEFINKDELINNSMQKLLKRKKRSEFEAEELIRQSRWEDIIALYFPLEEKAPELTDHGLDIRLRMKIAMALGRLNRFDEAISELEKCVKSDPNNFLVHSSLGYTAYDSLYAANKREIFLSREQKAKRIQMAHESFRHAQRIRPDNVTCYYREGMLFKQIEDKPEKALPLFQKAVENWERLSPEEKKEKHQTRKNYVKSLYQLASCKLYFGDPASAKQLMLKCIKEDETSAYISLVFKYYALGKIHFQADEYPEARDALSFALQCSKQSKERVDYVHELLARVYLSMNNPRKALEIIDREPKKNRRPYYRWTEADVYCALGQFQKAITVLKESAERDKRSKHKTLLKLSQISYLLKDFNAAVKYSKQADEFFERTWGNPYPDALFWQALSLFRANEQQQAKKTIEKLKRYAPFYPNLGKIMKLIQS